MSEEKKIMFGSGWNLWTKILKRWIWICKKEILTKVENIQPYLSSVAKQGDDPNVSITSLDRKLGIVVMMTEDEKQPALNELLSHIV